MAWTKILTTDDTLSSHIMLNVPTLNFIGNNTNSEGRPAAVSKSELLAMLNMTTRAIGNVSLSTQYVGSTSLAKGNSNITTGKWQGNALSVSKGGTGVNISSINNTSGVLISTTANTYSAISGTSGKNLVRSTSNILFDYIDVGNMATGILPLANGGAVGAAGAALTLVANSYLAVESSVYAIKTSAQIATAVTSAATNGTSTIAHTHPNYYSATVAPAMATVTGKIDFAYTSLTNNAFVKTATAPATGSVGNMYVTDTGNLMVNL